MAYATQHNGKRLQVNPSFVSDEHMFVNLMMQAQRWDYADNSGAPSPDEHDVNGYPLSISHGGWRTTIPILAPEHRPGHVKVVWTGVNTTITGPGTPTGGSFTGGATGGWFTVNPSDTQMAITITASTSITSLAVYYTDDEADYLAGQTANSRWLDQGWDYAVLRMLNLVPGNNSNITRWEHRKSDTYVHGSSELRASLYKGATSNVGNAYTCDFGDGGTPQDGDTWGVQWNATATDTSLASLNGKPLRALHTGVIGVDVKPTANVFGMVTYNALLDMWLATDTGVVAQGLNNGIAIEKQLKICAEAGAHLWYTVPVMALDGPSDYVEELATFCKGWTEANAPWMKVFYQTSNEVWNYTFGFPQTGFADAVALERYGSGSYKDADGRWLSLMGATLATVYEGDQSRYEVICGIQTVNAAADESARMSGRHVSVDAGDPASDYVTGIAAANYFGTPLYGKQAELDLAYDFSLADEAGKDEIAEEYTVEVLADTMEDFSVKAVLARFDSIIAFASAQAGPHKPVYCYEGGNSPDYHDPQARRRHPITGATKAASCVLTYGLHEWGGYILPAVGQQVSISGVGGMTQLNGNTYTVTARDLDAHTVTINVNSTGFDTFTSGGTSEIVDYVTLVDALRRHSKNSPSVYDAEYLMFEELIKRRVKYPSVFMMSGEGAWGANDPYIIPDVVPERIRAVRDINDATIPLNWNFRLRV